MSFRWYKDEDMMRIWYIEDDLSQTEIAEKCNTDQATISRWLNKHEIETPDESEYQLSGPPAGNQHNRKHGLNADPKLVKEDLDSDESAFVENVREAIINRIAAHHDPDFLDESLIDMIAVKICISMQASEYIQKHGLTRAVQRGDSVETKANPLLGELRLYDSEIFRELKKLGILDDPDSQQADALTAWRAFVQHES